MNKEAAKPLKEQIYAVQQVFVMKARRVEVNPFWSFTLNDQFVSHPGPGLAINYYITNVLAIGINGEYYNPFNVDSDFNAQVRRAARVGVPLTEYNWAAALNFTYVPANGKFAGFGDFIFHYDAYIVGGVGAISTRPIPVIDPDNRNFKWKTNLDFNAGLGLRIFFNRWFAATLEVRDYVFNDKLENTSIGTTLAEQQDEGTWYGDSKLTNNVQAQVGVSIFIPFSFDYRLPK
jgi:outer membrane beta-barrel protein